MSLSTALAKALFDNAAESPEELAFRKGDILMVLDQKGGGPGWWLCSLHGRQGIAPANRLRLLNTSQSSPTTAGEGAAPCSTVAGPPSEDSVYLSPTPHPWPDPAAGAKDVGEGVYLSPPLLGATATAAAALRRGDGRPRSHSSSGSRPRADWEACAPGRARSPSLRGRGSETGASKQQTLYQTPTAHKTHGGLAPEAVYLSPFGIPRAATDGPSLELGGADMTYLVPREAVVGVGNCEGCYLVPRVSTAPSEEVYQTPTGGAAGDSAQGGFTCSAALGARRDSLQSTSVSGTTLTAQTKPAQEDMGLYQTPTLTGGLPKTPQNGRKIPGEAVLPPVTAVSGLGPQRLMASSAEGSPRPQPKAPHKIPGSQSASPMPPSTRGRLPQAPLRNSPVLPRMAGAKVQGSPNFSRKPPPPAPPVRGVTKKEPAQTQPCAALQVAQVTGQCRAPPNKLEGQRDGRTKEEESAAKKRSSAKKDDEEGEYEEPDDENIRNQVYDTPPTSRWQQSVPAALPMNDDDSIYNTPRVLPPQSDQGSEVYDVPALALSKSPDLQQPAYNIPGGTAGAPEGEDDVYSVPTLPGVSAVPGEVSDGSALEAERHEVYCVPGSGKCVPLRQNDGAPCPEVSIEGCECDCGIYDMPALSLDVPLSSTRRSSVSSTGSGDIQWRTSLSTLIQSALSSASSSTPPRELVASLTEILSVWKGCQAAETSPPLMQAWSRLSDIVSVLSTCGSPSPSEAQLSLVRRTLEDSASLLQSQALPPLGRPRLPSQESLSRRPLPALPVAEVKPLNVGMGGRKGSWIQERPLPPPPTPSFPLRPTAPAQPGASEEGEGDDLGNEYAGIGLTSTPAPFTGDSVGYVKLQGKPEPPAVIQTEETPLAADPSSSEQRLSPSPPLPVSLSLEDSELLSFYSSQSLSHLSCLADSIDALFTSVQGNQPPRVFVSRGKSLIVTAHKLVFIGDTLSRLLTSPDLRTKVTTSGGRLCQALKAVVVATKGAAQNYPSVPATQEMVDRVAELSQHAAGFSGLLQRLAEIS